MYESDCREISCWFINDRMTDQMNHLDQEITQKLKTLKFIEDESTQKNVKRRKGIYSSLLLWCDITWADLEGTPESRTFVSQIR